MSADDELRGMLEGLGRDYKRSLPASLERIDTAWAAISGGSADASGVKTLERALHSIAGAAGTFGLPALSAAAAAAESFVEPYAGRSAVPAASELPELERLIDAVKKEAAQ